MTLLGLGPSLGLGLGFNLVRLGHEVEPAQQVVGDPLVVEQQRHAVDVGDVVHADALLRRHL